MTIENLSLRMVRPHLGDIPQYELPAPYRFRMFQPGDADTWVAIQGAADKLSKISHHLFDRQFGSDLEAMPQRSFFICNPQGEAIGNATAWYKEYEGEIVGRVHWVAVVPEYQGRGLSKPLMTAVMNRLAELHDRAILDTATPRLVAIKVYLDFGFLPDMRNDEDRRAWLLVRRRLDHRTLRTL